MEVMPSPVKGKSTGTLVPLCRFKMNKENEIQLEVFQNPWKLVDVMPRK